MKPERRLVSRETARLLPIVVPVALSGFAVLAFAIGEFVASNPEPEVLAGVFALLLAATFVEAHPVPIEGISSEGISLAAVFIVGTAVIYGWAPAVVMGFLTRALIEMFQRRPAIRLSYNSGVYALGGGAAGVCIHTPPKGERPVADAKNAGGQAERTIYLELIVDGDIVDLNRIPLPPDTPISDERFKKTDPATS